MNYRTNVVFPKKPQFVRLNKQSPVLRAKIVSWIKVSDTCSISIGDNVKEEQIRNANLDCFMLPAYHEASRTHLDGNIEGNSKERIFDHRIGSLKRETPVLF